jgi:hypothetical protein
MSEYKSVLRSVNHKVSFNIEKRLQGKEILTFMVIQREVWPLVSKDITKPRVALKRELRDYTTQS